MTNDLKRKLTSYTLLLSLLLSGCGKKSDCEIPTKHAHKYTKEITDDIELERYIHDEHLKIASWNWTEDYLEITEKDEELYDTLNKKNLFPADKNWDYLYHTMETHNDYLMFYYEYYTTENYTTTDDKGNVQVHTKIVHHDGWTPNPYNTDNTGRTRLFHHKYFAYRVVKEKDKFKLERSPLVDDIREVLEEYPYVGEACYTTEYEELRYYKYELPSLSPEQFDIFQQPDLSNKDISFSKPKTYKKN